MELLRLLKRWRGTVLVMLLLAVGMGGLFYLGHRAEGAAAVEAVTFRHDSGPQVVEEQPDFVAPYVFVHITEQNMEAFRGWPAAEAIARAATYNSDTESLYILNQPDRLNHATRAVVLAEGVSPLAWLYSEVHVINALPWAFEFPEFVWLGLYTSGPDAGRVANMVDNSQRLVRGQISIQDVRADGTVSLSFGREHRTLGPGDRWVIEDTTGVSALVIRNFGNWSTDRITYGTIVHND